MRKPILLALAALLAAPAAFTQGSAPAPEKQEKPKAKRVWTNEDIGAVRKPWDNHEEQKRQAEEKARLEGQQAGKPAEAARTADAAKPEADAAKEDYLPKTMEEAESRIAEKREEIEGHRQLVAKTREEYYNAPSEQIAEARKRKLAELTAELEEAEAELLALLKRQEALRTRAGGAAPAATQLQPQRQQ